MMLTKWMKQLGEEMLADANLPANDCIIYKNTYKMWCDFMEDSERVQNKLSKMALQAEARKLGNEMFRMYLTNYAVGEYRKERWAAK